MLVIYVITAVIGFVIYTVIRVKVQEWLEDLRMSRLKLNRYRYSDENSMCTSSSSAALSDVVEISDDESDASYDAREHMKERNAVLPVSNENDCIYQADKDDIDNLNMDSRNCIGTEKVDNDVEDFLPNHSLTSKSRNPMFTWNNKGGKKSRNRGSQKKLNTIVYNSDESSDDFKQDKNPRHKETGKRFKFSNGFYHREEPQKGKVKDETPAEVVVQHELMIAGVKVKLPVKPYSCQIAVMNKVIQGCTKVENCLLESPTGTGKTLALLCSVLAWQDHFKAEIEKEIIKNSQCGDPMYDDDFSQLGPSDEMYCCEDYEKKSNIPTGRGKNFKIPKVYYGTRTHKQIEQVVRELRKTAYTNKRMTILSSREHTCIQNGNRNKTDLCSELLDPTKLIGCPFYTETTKRNITTFSAVCKGETTSIWDIEDLVTAGKEEGVCPYFTAKALMVDADIIFCPYNYLIDPDIRESMQIDLKDQVVILDEAHNIEDTCRNVASVNIRADYLLSASAECEVLMKQRAADFETYEILRIFLQKLNMFLTHICVGNLSEKDTLSSPYWTGEELIEVFKMHKIDQSLCYSFVAAGNAAIADCNKAKEDGRVPGQRVKPILSQTAQRFIEQLIFAIQMISSETTMNDYRACVIESMVKDFIYVADDTWQSAQKREQRVRTLKLLCMNAGVVFAPLANFARTILLASGTLTPTTSFQSELGTKFVHVLNAPHVIPKDQVYATCIPKGPNDVPLKANYQNVNSWKFQDELGNVLLDVCQSVPHGVLCFFSSYNMMNTQIQRWKKSSTWSNITDLKRVFLEPRYSGDLGSIMREYREVIKATSKGPQGNINGALLLAVFRGKVAEGIDFSDDEARCVMAVGIPYAVMKDPEVDMKMKYNDKNKPKGLLGGSEWYSVQAFRALNQALGRCLRHINDWGAVLLVDERFLSYNNINSLPKWVKSLWVEQRGYNLKEELTKFVARQRAKGIIE